MHGLTVLLLSTLAPLTASAAEGTPDVVVQWLSPTCDEATIEADVTSRSRSMCGADKLVHHTWQYQDNRSARGCDVWAHAWCTQPPVAPTYVPPGKVVLPTVYVDKDYGGVALALPPGETNLVWTPVRGSTDVWNKKVSSVRVPQGFTLRLCSEPGGTGRCTDFTADHNDTSFTYVGGDAAMYATVVKGTLPPVHRCPVAFEHDNFRGKELEICDDIPDLTGSDWNDSISSILVPPGWTVLLCANASGSAPCKETSTDVGKMNATVVGSDKTTSVMIKAKPR